MKKHLLSSLLFLDDSSICHLEPWTEIVQQVTQSFEAAPHDSLTMPQNFQIIFKHAFATLFQTCLRVLSELCMATAYNLWNVEILHTLYVAIPESCTRICISFIPALLHILTTAMSGIQSCQ